ncbi:hypothetical protein DPMN_000700 [Dreissena polymorpha]|uniref:Uncharacterized protein n=1 Tax=Dreissena polymorpha TaxID=45954 RepID=A0A9D4MJI4_DREPO|nr:hypothetical protein DPMN_000700 [Dreissena polymorpha]
MKASNCLRLRNVINSESLSRFQYSLNTDVASSRLKLASILYWSGHFNAALRVLEVVEKRYHRVVKDVCGIILIEGDRDLQVLANMLSGNKYKGFSELQFAFCVRFLREETYCVPCILLYEMKPNITEEEIAERHPVHKRWMDSAEVDARPSLNYLQCLTYGGIGGRDDQLRALDALRSNEYVAKIKINLYHQETALNMLGHCYEIEGEYDLALYYYEVSLSLCNPNNAANWHLERILRLIGG